MHQIHSCVKNKVKMANEIVFIRPKMYQIPELMRIYILYITHYALQILHDTFGMINFARQILHNRDDTFC